MFKNAYVKRFGVLFGNDEVAVVLLVGYDLVALLQVADQLVSGHFGKIAAAKDKQNEDLMIFEK